MTQFSPGFGFRPWLRWWILETRRVPGCSPCSQGRAERRAPDTALHPLHSKASRASSAFPAPQGMQAHLAREATRDPPAHEDSSGSVGCQGCPARGVSR